MIRQDRSYDVAYIFRIKDDGHLNIGSALRPGTVTLEAIRVDGELVKGSEQ